MGIIGLTKLLKENAKSSFKEHPLNYYHGRKIAIDASMFLYQFMIAVRTEDGKAFTNESGEETMHLNGLFYRTIKFLELGIKPLYVFDGKAPDLKSDELDKRRAIQTDALEKVKEAEEAGDTETAKKYTKRSVRITSQHNDDAKKLLTLMGVPYLEAPCEAEAQCAQLQKKDLVYAVATEDMDTMTFGSERLLRNFNASESKKLPIVEISLSSALKELEINMSQFVDLCILLGCDYTSKIKNLGPKKSLNMIKKGQTLEDICEELEDHQRFQIPPNWNYKQARKLLTDPDVLDEDFKFEWKRPDSENLLEFMVKEKGFNESRIKSAIAKITASLKKSTQTRMESFVSFVPRATSESAVKKEPAIKAKKPKIK